MSVLIKGVSRQIIEVNDTRNTYYDKAWLVVKPEYAALERRILEQEARKLLKEMDSPSAMKPGRSVMFWVLRLGGSALMGAAISALLQFII